MILIIDMQKNMYEGRDITRELNCIKTLMKKSDEDVVFVLSKRYKGWNILKMILGLAFPKDAELLKEIDGIRHKGKTEKIFKYGVCIKHSNDIKKLEKYKNEQIIMVGGYAEQCVKKALDYLTKKQYRVAVDKNALIYDKSSNIGKVF